MTTLITLLSSVLALAQGQAAMPPIQTVDFDPVGGFRINGKPFFPIALYDAPMDDQTLRELRAFHFNVLTCDAKSCARLRAEGFYGMVHDDKKIDDLTGVFMGVGADSPALLFKKDLLKQVAEANARTRAAVPRRPILNAIGYWENEPKGVFEGTLPTKAVYEDLVAAIDVSAPYLYPVPHQPISSVGDAVARARKASSGKKPVLPVLQIFVWKATDRYPTPAELRCMAFLSLVEGAHGIAFFSYSSVTGRPKTTLAAAQPELWKSVKRLNREIGDLGPRLLGGTEPNDLWLGTNTRSVRMKLVREKEGTLALMVNSAATPQEVRLILPATNRGLQLVENGKSIEVTDGVATLLLDPFGVRILRLQKAP